MALSTWWQGDPRPALPPLSGMTVSTFRDVATLARVTSLDVDEIVARLVAGNRAYVASVDGVPAAYGWVATLSASIGELGLAFDVPATDRYLWDFVTLPDHRGRGIYPRLLQSIIESEGSEARHFWIIHAPENGASRSGIARAGFRTVSELAFQSDLSPGTASAELGERARAGARVLGVPLLKAVDEGRVVSPCWRCVMTGAYHVSDSPACWPRHGHAVPCACVVPAAVPA
jgi:GNAT superfamily N-acetyltransferase